MAIVTKEKAVDKQEKAPIEKVARVKDTSGN